MAAKKSASKKARKPRKQYSPEKRAEILAEAKAQKLTGKQVAAKYNISMVTFYLWKKKAGGGLRNAKVGKAGKSGLPLGAGFDSRVRAAVETKVREVLPGIVDREVAAYLKLHLGAGRS